MKAQKKETHDHGRTFDWGRASADYAKYRDIYPESFFEKIFSMGLCKGVQRVLDLGTGTGVLPRGLYKYGASFTGADVSENQIAEARRLSAEAGMDIRYVVSPAETVGFPAGSFDAVTACQCFIYFDKAAVYPNIHSMLAKNGRLAVMSVVWLPGESEIAAASEKLVLKYNPYWTGHSYKRQPLSDPGAPPELFALEAETGFDLNISFTRESWRGRIRACRGVGASSLSGAELDAFEKEHAEYLSGCPERFDIPHYASIICYRKK